MTHSLRCIKVAGQQHNPHSRVVTQSQSHLHARHKQIEVKPPFSDSIFDIPKFLLYLKKGTWFFKKKKVMLSTV